MASYPNTLVFGRTVDGANVPLLVEEDGTLVVSRTVVQVATAGALSGDGSSGSKLAVKVDGTTIHVNGSNQLAAITAGIVPTGWTWAADGLTGPPIGDGTPSGGAMITATGTSSMDAPWRTTFFSAGDGRAFVEAAWPNDNLDFDMTLYASDGVNSASLQFVGADTDGTQGADLATVQLWASVGGGAYNQFLIDTTGFGFWDATHALSWANHPFANGTAFAAFYASDLTGYSDNNYLFWGDTANGVLRAKYDDTFDSVEQIIIANYNPQYATYLPGTPIFERGVLGQWNGNVLELGATAGAAQTLTTLTSVGTTATATLVGINAPDGAVVMIAGADQTEYSGTYTITRIDNDSFSYTFAGSVTSPATGTITAQGGTLRALKLLGSAVSTAAVFQAGGYKSSDGSAGATAGPFTVITAITVKNGLVTSITGT